MKVSVITAAYNSGEKIVRCIKSVNRQTYENLEHIFIDGGSTDDTVAKINESTRLNRVLSEPDSGIYNALNKGIQLASGDLIIFLHTDDVFGGEDTISNLVSFFRADPDLEGVYGNICFVKWVGSQAKVVRKWTSSDFQHASLAFGWMPPHTALMIPKNVFDDVGVFNEKLKISGDYEFLLRFLSKDPKISYFNENITEMEIGGISTKFQYKSLILKFEEDLLALRMNNAPYPMFTAICKRLRKLKQLVV